MDKANKEDLKNELSLLGSSLADKRHDGEFPVPDNFFETLPGIIQNRLVLANSPAQRLFMAIAAHKLATAMVAVSMLLILTVGLSIFGPGKGNDMHAGMDDSEFLSLYASLDSYYLYDMAVASGLNGDESKAVPDYESHAGDDDGLNGYFYQLIDHYSLDPEYFHISGN